jgi:predicted ATPase
MLDYSILIYNFLVLSKSKIMPDKKKNYPESIGSFSIQNYRIFDEKYEFNFKPITFLIGPNSSGKSSLMKLLSAVSNSSKKSSKYSFVPSLLGSDLDNNNALFVDFSKSLNIKNDPLLFSYDSNRNSLAKFNVNYNFSYVSNNSSSNIIFNSFSIRFDEKNIFSISKSNRDYQVSIIPKAILNLAIKILTEEKKKDSLQRLVSKDFSHIEHYNIFSVSNEYVDDFKRAEEIIFNVDNKIEVSSGNLTELYITRYFGFDEFGDYGLAGFFNLFFHAFMKQSILNHLNLEEGDLKIEFSDFGKYLTEDFPNYLESDYKHFLSTRLDYVHTPVYKKARDRVFYLNETKTTSFDILIKAYIQSNQYYFKDEILRSDTVIDYWLQKFGLGKTWIVRRVEPSEQYYIVEIEKDNGELINIADLGYGAGQVLAFILMPFYLEVPAYSTVSSFSFIEKENKSQIIDEFGIRQVTYNDGVDSNGNKSIFKVYLEEPETNLHPNWQSILAELIVYQISIGIRFVIETHSEYLIRKIQNLIAQKKCDQNDVVIYYFNTKNNSKVDLPVVKEIKINRNGTLTDSFGPGFFDEAGRLSLELLSINSISKN